MAIGTNPQEFGRMQHLKTQSLTVDLCRSFYCQLRDQITTSVTHLFRASRLASTDARVRTDRSRASKVMMCESVWSQVAPEVVLCKAWVIVDVSGVIDRVEMRNRTNDKRANSKESERLLRWRDIDTAVMTHSYHRLSKRHSR
jgi:hypothetical protein